MKKVSVIFFLALHTPLALANWVYVASADDGSEIYYDPTTLVKRQYLRVWIYVNLGTPTNGVFSIRTLTEIDCKEQRQRSFEFTGFAGRNLSGELLGVENKMRDWSYYAPGTAFIRLYKKICK